MDKQSEDLKQYRRKSKVYDGMVRSPNRSLMRATACKMRTLIAPW